MFAKWSSRQNVLYPRVDSKSTMPECGSNNLVFKSGEFTRQGRKHDHNEDRVRTRILCEEDAAELICMADMLKETIPTDDMSRVLLSIVTDGHGGSATSQFVANNLLECIAREQARNRVLAFADLETSVLDAFKACDDLLDTKHPFEPSGCCAMATAVFENQAIIAHIGDVRAVLYEAGEVRQVTKDHRATEPGETLRIVENGGQVINNRIQGVLAPSRAFGNKDLRAVLPPNVLICEPSICRVCVDEAKIRKQYCFLIIASDGVWDCLSNEQACDLVYKTLKSTGGLATAAAKKLVELAAKKNDDDVTANVIVWMYEDAGLVEADKL